MLDGDKCTSLRMIQCSNNGLKSGARPKLTAAEGFIKVSA